MGTPRSSAQDSVAQVVRIGYADKQAHLIRALVRNRCWVVWDQIIMYAILLGSAAGRRSPQRSCRVPVNGLDSATAGNSHDHGHQVGTHSRQVPDPLASK